MTLRDYIGRDTPDLDIYRFEELRSTNDTVRDYVQRGRYSVVIAERQSGGRGQRGRRFSSEPGGLYYSLGFYPEFPLERCPSLTALGALAARNAIGCLTSVYPDIKYPNDLLINGKKIAGVLTEAVHRGNDFFIVLGIGINVFNPLPPELDSAGTLNQLTGAEVDIEMLAGSLTRELLDILA